MEKVKWYSRPKMNIEIWKHIKYADTILDIGCGIRPQKFIDPTNAIICEPCAEYVAKLKELHHYNGNVTIFNEIAQETLKRELDVESIFILDVIEHINKEEGQEILEKCKKIARKQIVLFTPLGELPRTYEQGEKDAWGLTGGYWQTHKSGWSYEDFDEEWEILACKHYHYVSARGEIEDTPKGAFWAIWNSPQSNTYKIPIVSQSIFNRIFCFLWDISVIAEYYILRYLPRWFTQPLLKLAIASWVRAVNLGKRMK